MAENTQSERITAMRRFNRFYTQKIGVLREGLLASPFSLTEARVIYELANRSKPTSTELARDLQIDPGYLSRILRDFERQGLMRREPSSTDGRQQLLVLTPAGAAAFAQLNASSADEIGALLGTLVEADQQRLLTAMRTIEGLLGERQDEQPYTLRPHRPGDMGWVVHRHGALYAQEYGWDERFEALVAEIVAHFIERFDPARERCWIAERHGANVGSVFLVKHPEREGVARLRLLLVEPSARGLGIGRRLVEECTRFARQTGYHAITLWTNDVLVSARRIYEAAGYRLVHQAPHHGFGHDLVEQTWELTLGDEVVE